MKILAQNLEMINKEMQGENIPNNTKRDREINVEWTVEKLKDTSKEIVFPLHRFCRANLKTVKAIKN